MSYCNKIIAKSNKETLIEHTKNCLDNFNLFREIESDKIDCGLKAIAKQYYLGDFNLDFFWIHAFESVAFHDFGKSDNSFQNMIKEKINGIYSGKKALPHALISGIEMFKQERNDLLYNKIPISTICVASHHSMLSEHLFLTHGNLQNLDLCDYKQFIDFVNMEYAKIFRNKNISFKDEVVDKIDYTDKIKHIHHEIQKLNYSQELFLRYIYLLVENILHFCDWHASSVTPVNFLPIYDNKVKTYLENKPTFKEFNELQKFALNKEGSVIIESPTGSGKTEASVLWSGYNRNKLLYLLPTMNTTNSIYKRLTNIFGLNCTGLLHSTSDLFYIDSDFFDYNQEDFSKFYSKTFSMPVMVATVDQVLYSLYNINRWDSVLFNSILSNIVFDEIHAYDSKTIAHIIAFINQIAPFKPNIMLMTATMPDVLRNFIINKSEVKFDYKEFMAIRDYNSEITVCDEKILNSLPLIKQNLEYKKILIVANTIKTAKALFLSLKNNIGTDKKIILFHSQFTYEDKNTKVAELDSDNIIAVCTQIVEVSLDIDFDVLFTECSPVDSLVQRFGRVNRYGNKKNSKIFIMKWEENSEHVYNKKYIENTYENFKNLGSPNYKEIKKVMNSIYSDEYIEDLEKAFNEAKERINSILYKNLKGIYRFDIDEQIANKYNLIRDINYPTKLAIPSKYYDKVYGKYKESLHRGWLEFLRYAINIPYNRDIKTNLSSNNEFKISYFNYDYDSTCGINFDKINIESTIY
jgi:CRISPR-associated endonuclease/helicase Cas3